MAIKFGRPLEATVRFSPVEAKSVPARLDLTARPRRNRQSEWVRRMVREHVLTSDDLIWPLFLVDGERKRMPVASMPGVERLSVDLVAKAAAEAAGLGIPVNRVFLLTFAMGSGLAGLGGALGAEVLGLDPTFPLKFMIYFLVVVAVGGTTTITGPMAAAILLGIADVAGKYYVPKLGSFIVYTLMIAILLVRPQGLFVRRGAGR